MTVARIEDIVSEFVRLKKRGVNLLGMCPFHDEKTPSFTVSPVKGIYKCFGCGKAGNSVNFIMEHENMSYPEALKYLADKYGIPVEENLERAESVEQKTDRESIFILLSAAQKYYSDVLLNSEEGKTIGLTYFKERELSQKTIELFQLGWSMQARDAFSTWAIESGYRKEYLTRTGLSIESNDGRLFDRFHERVMFPIHNQSGKVVGFGGRLIKSKPNEGKYINSPETELYNKSKLLYGLHLAKKAIRQHDRCILVEGYMDVLSMYQAGIENVVASSGTSLTEEQLQIIKRFTENVVFFFDGDAAGQKASVRALEMALNASMNPVVVTLPEGEDPDSFARKNTLEFILYFISKEGKDFIGYSVSLLTEEQKRDPLEKAKAIRKLLGMVIMLHDNLKEAFYVKEIEKALNVSEKVLYAELRKLRIDKFKKENKPHSTEVNIQPPPIEPEAEIKTEPDGSYQERMIVKMLVLYGNRPYDANLTVADYILGEVTQMKWNDELCIIILEAFYTAIKKKYASLASSNNVHIELDDVEFDPEILEKLLFDELPVGDFMEYLPTDSTISSFITGMQAERYEISNNWKRFLGRDIVTPDENYTEEIKSSVNHFLLRKVQQLLIENKEKLSKTQEEEEINTHLDIHSKLLEMKKRYAALVGISIL